jgi:hypothetical protein
MKIWTNGYRPFIMGGDVNAPVFCDVPVDGPFDLGKGYEGFLAVSPSGRTFVAESITGAIVGSTVAEVRKDVTTADEAIMKEQIAEAQKRVRRAERVSPADFWRMLKAG